jgi:hypothetical protein
MSANDTKWTSGLPMIRGESQKVSVDLIVLDREKLFTSDVSLLAPAKE